ncbi:MAG TPA: hypothetical protein VJA21_00675 [Verrucomicrobiae bacterium]
MKLPAFRLILCAVGLTAGIAAPALAQNVYSLGIYAGGTFRQELCSFDIPFPPYHYKITQRSRYEDAEGFIVMDVGNETQRGGVLCRYWDVEWGTESFTIWLDREQPLRARLLVAESAERERREKAWLASGFFQTKTFVLSNRTDSLEDQEVLFELKQREKFKDGGYGKQAMGPEPNVFRITASTNDMVIWDRIMREFDKPHRR